MFITIYILSYTGQAARRVTLCWGWCGARHALLGVHFLHAKVTRPFGIWRATSLSTRLIKVLNNKTIQSGADHFYSGPYSPTIDTIYSFFIEEFSQFNLVVIFKL
jgi:hypothetical protein